MALHIIDRRLAGKNKSVGNRERFVRRFKEQIAEAVRKAVSARDIRHIDQAESITIPKKDIQEPVFSMVRVVSAIWCCPAIVSMCVVIALPGRLVAAAVRGHRPAIAARGRMTSLSP